MNKSDLKTLYSEDQIKTRIKALAKDITSDYRNINEPLVVISVLKGAFIFTADLIRNFDISIQLEFVKISSYGSNKTSSGKIEAPILLLPDLSKKHILIVEDIVDSGRTVAFLKEYISTQYKPESLRVACLLSKPSRREVEINPEYVGFVVDDYFLVGYGLDYAEDYRHLPYLAICD